MAESLKPVALLLLILNLCMYAILAIIGGWAVNISIDRGFILGPGMRLPAHFHPIFFPIGNWATGFFVVFSLLAGVVGIASGLVGFSHIRHWNYYSLQPAATTGLLAWALTVLAMGLACQEISLDRRNAKLNDL
uniref:ABA induced plasma membrane protein n=1 Tax=Oryza rufipogon TaxID=4529 RepID=A0A0E0MTW1_ORYRU